MKLNSLDKAFEYAFTLPPHKVIDVDSETFKRYFTDKDSKMSYLMVNQDTVALTSSDGEVRFLRCID